MNKDVNKYQEAIKYARRGFAFYEKWTIEYFDLLQELVDKATPMKPTQEATRRKDDTCPNCGNVCSHYERGFKITADYCQYCGQALDWSEDNE